MFCVDWGVGMFCFSFIVHAGDRRIMLTEFNKRVS